MKKYSKMTLETEIVRTFFYFKTKKYKNDMRLAVSQQNEYWFAPKKGCGEGLLKFLFKFVNMSAFGCFTNFRPFSTFQIKRKSDKFAVRLFSVCVCVENEKLNRRKIND